MGNLEIAACLFALLAFLAGALRAYQKFTYIAAHGHTEHEGALPRRTPADPSAANISTL